MYKKTSAYLVWKHRHEIGHCIRADFSSETESWLLLFVADLFKHLKMSVIFFVGISSDNWLYIGCGFLVKMIVIYTEAVQLCCSLNDTLSQMVHIAITAGLDCSHLNRHICIKLQVLVVLFKSMANWASLFTQARQQARGYCILHCSE